jgi:hypothetical protein
MPPDPEVLRKVAQWVTYGDGDMRVLELCPREEGWGAEETVTREEALRAIKVAARVRQVVREALARAGVHLREELPS